MTMGRPLKQIDGPQVEKLAAMFCTDAEIAAFFDTCQNVIRRRFREQLTRGRSVGKMSLKRKQYSLAMDGHPTMLIWLGKQYLDQHDKVEQKFKDETPGRKAVENLTDDELKKELEKHAAAAGVAGRVESPPGAEEPA